MIAVAREKRVEGKRRARALLLAAMACALPALAQAGGANAAGEALAARINALDARFFDAFNACDVDRHIAMLDPELEFFHDKGGFTKGRHNMEKMSRERCALAGTRLRREVVEGSLEVHPVPGYGAIQQGAHRFYLAEDGGEERLIEIARFVHVWEQGDAGWKIVRALSYDHKVP